MDNQPASTRVLVADEAVRQAEESLRTEPPERRREVLALLRLQFPEEGRLWHLSGKVAEVDGSRDEAEECYRRALAIEPSEATCALDLLELLLDDDDRLEEAAAMASGLAARLGESSRAQALLGRSRALRGRPREAEVSLRRALDLDPRNAWAGRELVEVLSETGRQEEARRVLDGLLDLDPLDPRNHGYLADLFARSGHLEQALDELRTAILLDPDYSWARTELAAVLCGAGRLPEAREVLLEAVDPGVGDRRAGDRGPADPGIAAALGAVERSLGDAAAAERWFREALRVHPRSEAAFQGLFDLLCTSGRVEDARALVQSALETLGSPGAP